jgi:hypothetical protein
MDKAILEFLASGGKIVKCKPRAPRKGEKTWTASRYSIANIGAKAMTTGKRGIRVTRDYV